MNKKQVTWINCAKCVAILGVMLDHTYSMLYLDPGIQRMTQFAVPLFILLAGITSYLTGGKYLRKGWLNTFWHKIKKILLAYLIASVLYHIVMSRSFDIKGLLLSLIHFNASGPLYYVALYVQLMFVFWPLNKVLHLIPEGWRGMMAEIALGAALLGVGFWTTNGPSLLGIAAGGGKILGGTFLFLFYLGMVLEKHQLFSAVAGTKGLILALVITVPLMLVFDFLLYARQMEIDGWFPVGEGINPPGVLLMGLAVIMLLFCYALFCALDKGLLHKPVAVLGKLGQHTLYLFLYHKLFLDTANHFLRTRVPLAGRWLIYFAVMLTGPLLIEWVFHKIKDGVKRLVHMGARSGE